MTAVLPLTRGQLDIWLVQQTAHIGTDWQLGLSMRIERRIDPDLMELAIRRTVCEVEQRGVDSSGGQVFQKAIDHPHVELAFHDLSCSQYPVRGSPQDGTVSPARSNAV